MSARDEALARDLAARARLEGDPIHQVKQRRDRRGPQYRGASEPTPREIAALRYMSHGLTREMTAEAMGVTMQSVMTYLTTARLRLGAKNTSHACCEAIRRGLIP